MDEIVELIVASILEKIIEKVCRRTSNKELIPSKEKDADQNRIDLNFGEIHEEVKTPNENTMGIFVPYGVPTIGSYGTPVFKNGIPITDKRKNYMPIPEYGEYGFYVDVPVSFGDFKGIKDSGESFKKIWDAKGYEEKVRVIALNNDGVLPRLLRPLLFGSPASLPMVTSGGANSRGLPCMLLLPLALLLLP